MIKIFSNIDLQLFSIKMDNSSVCPSRPMDPPLFLLKGLTSLRNIFVDIFGEQYFNILNIIMFTNYSIFSK